MVLLATARNTVHEATHPPFMHTTHPPSCTPFLLALDRVDPQFPKRVVPSASECPQACANAHVVWWYVVVYV